MNDRPTIFLTAADASGDCHAAGLIAALRRRLPEVRCVGIGGPAMAAAGCELLEDTVAGATMLTGVFAGLGHWHALIGRTRRRMAEIRPDVHVPVDSPALNWHLAKAARRLGVPVMYYVAPQVWAWAPWRIRKVRRLTDAVACILPFEQEYFRSRGVNAHYVGHPLFDAIAEPNPPDLADAAATGRWRIALLPGSRAAEIAGHAGPLAEVMDRLARSHPRAEFTFTARDELAAERIRAAAELRHGKAGRDDLPIAVGITEGVLARSHFAVVASGTVTLEAAWFGVPMVIFHRAGRLIWLAARWMIRTPFLSLVNILAGERLVPELMPWHGSVDQLAAAAEGVLSDLPRMIATRRRLLDLTAPLKVPPPATAADNAAELTLRTLRSRGG